MDCLGDQRDAGYFFSQPLPLDAGQIYAVVSTLGTKTGNATYSALSVNDASMMAGVANVLDTTLEGSADGYATTVDDYCFVNARTLGLSSWVESGPLRVPGRT